MTQAIFIGKWIYQQLTANNEISRVCPNKVFPLVAEQTTTFPFIVYWRNNITGEHCKDGYHQDQVSFTIIAVSDNYVESLKLAQAIRESIEGTRYLYNNDGNQMEISFCKLASIDETYQENAFVQTLQFDCTVN